MADKENEVSYLDMSDEDLAKIDPSTIGQVPAQQVTDTDEGAATDEEVEGSAAADEGEGTTEGAQRTGEVADPKSGKASEEEGSAAAEGSKESNQKASAAEPDPAENESKGAKKPETTEAVIDYEAAYKKLTAPFKANGRDIQVTSVEDAVSLMQMGANYNKKMAALKPNLKLMKLLENNGLLNEEKLGYLIDLEKKNPEAISKLLKDSGLDPLDLDATKAAEYKPTARKVDDREIELDQVLEELHDSPAYNQTLDIVSNKWDAASKQVIAGSPQLLKVINNHVQSGIYDLINKEIEHERLFGRLNGLSDIEAYRQVGDAIQARGGFNHLVGNATNQGQQIQSKPVVVQPKPKMGDEDERRQKKLAAGGTKTAPSSKTPADFNPLALSDDEFNKLVKTNIL